MKKSKVFEKIKKILITVICIITVIFSMPVKSSADAGILESVASLVLLIPDGINLLLNMFVSDETEDVKFTIRLYLKDEDATLLSNNRGTLYNIEVTPYDIFTSGTPTIYGEYIEALDNNNNAQQNFNEQSEAMKNGTGDLNSTVQAGKEVQESANRVNDFDITDLTTKSTVKIPLLDANFFKKSSNDSSNSADILRPVVSNVYNNLRNFVLILMLVVLLYIGIRIIISSAVSEQVKYKEYIINWVVGICLLFLMQYIMSAIMMSTKTINNMLIINEDSEMYRIGFGTTDSQSSANIRSGAGTISEWGTLVSHPWQSIWKGINHLAGREYEIKTTLVQLPYSYIYDLGAKGVSFMGNGLADLNNEVFGDGWSKIATDSDKKVSNFVGRKLQIANNGALFTFNEDDNTVQDYAADLSGNPSILNAAVYNDDIKGFRAIYTCNIAEYCRTLTTFSSKYTHIYNNNKKTIMSDSDQDEENDYSSAAFWGYVFLYVLLTIETVIFLYKYLKRVLWLAFLTMIAPLIALMYPIDKVGDGKAQTFNMWFREYLFNSLIQPLHILLYIIFMKAGTQLMNTNVIYGIVAYAFLIPAEKFFKKMFGFDKASTPGGLGSPAAGMMAMRGLDRLGGFGPHGKGGKKDGSSSAGRSKIKYAKNPLATPMGSGIGGGQSDANGGIPGSSGLLGRGNGRTPIPNGGGSTKQSGRLKRAGRWANNRAKTLSGMAGVASNRLARKITGAKTSDLSKALFSPKGWAAMAETGGKFVGRNTLRLAGGVSGGLLGAGAGLFAGGLASALTGEDQIFKGVSAGAAVGGNRGMQTADSFRGFVNDLNESSKDLLASQDIEYAADRQAQEIFNENDYMDDSDREKVRDVILAGASKEEITNSLDKILKSNKSANELAFSAHVRNKFDLDTQEGYQKAVDTYSAELRKKGIKIPKEQLEKQKELAKEEIDKEIAEINSNEVLSEDQKVPLRSDAIKRKAKVESVAEEACYNNLAKKVVDKASF